MLKHKTAVLTLCLLSRKKQLFWSYCLHAFKALDAIIPTLQKFNSRGFDEDKTIVSEKLSELFTHAEQLFEAGL